MATQYAISYDRLWKMLIDLKWKKKDLQKNAGLSPSVISKMGRDESVNLDTLGKICVALHCGLSDIVVIRVKEI